MKTETTERTRCHSWHRSLANNRGFSLIELLIVLFLGLIILGAIYNVFNLQNRIFASQESQVELQQGIRAAMDLMTREIGMAGFDRTGNANAGIVAAGPNSINFTMDLNADGDTGDANENITYSLYTSDGIQRLGRNTGGGNQPVAEHVTALSFVYGLDTAGNIRTISVTLTGRTARPEPAGDFRTFTLTQVVTPRNIGF